MYRIELLAVGIAPTYSDHGVYPRVDGQRQDGATGTLDCDSRSDNAMLSTQLKNCLHRTNPHSTHQ
jgi:hypothetical protein